MTWFLVWIISIWCTSGDCVSISSHSFSQLCHCSCSFLFMKATIFVIFCNLLLKSISVSKISQSYFKYSQDVYLVIIFLFSSTAFWFCCFTFLDSNVVGFEFSLILSKTRWQGGLQVLNDFCAYQVFQYRHCSYSTTKAICCLIISCQDCSPLFMQNMQHMSVNPFFFPPSRNEGKERWVLWAIDVCWCLQVLPLGWSLCIADWWYEYFFRKCFP